MNSDVYSSLCILEYIMILYNRGHKTYSIKGQTVNILVFVGHTTSVPTMELWYR